MPKVATWNMQGGTNWTYVKTVLTTIAPDVLCVQECGAPPPNYNLAPRAGLAAVNEGLVNFGTQTVPLLYEIYHWSNPAGVQQSLAILTKVAPTAVTLTAAPAIAGVPVAALRPILSARIALGGVNIQIASLHSPSVFSATGPQIAAYGQAASTAVSVLAGAVPAAGTWFAMGDWNTASGNVIAGHAWSAVNAPYATHQGGFAIDYLVTQNPLAVAINAVAYATLPFASDHVPVAFQW